MRTNIINLNSNLRLALWQQDTLEKLPWSPKHAERSARLALSKAAALGIEKDEAVSQVFEMGLGGFFEANPHIPYRTWQAVSDEIAERCEITLAAA